MKHVAIIGAGPAGMTAAYELSRKGCRVEVFEASAHVGGMARSFELWGKMVDLGPHRFFSKDVRVNQLWNSLVGADQCEVTRMTRIYFRGRLLDYPLKPLHVVSKLGLGEAVRCVASYGVQCARRGNGKPLASFEDWTVNAFGRRLFELFFKDYSEKLWGIPCSEIDSAFAAQRIKKFSLGQAMLTALGLSGKKHRTLADQFPHPFEGAGVVYRRMADEVERAGGRIHLQSPVAGIADGGKTLRLHEGGERGFDAVVSTMPLTQLCASLPDVPGEAAEAISKLEYRSTVLVYLKVGAVGLFPDQWLYIQEPQLQLGRVTNFNNWPNGKDDQCSILALEYWCNEGTPEWARSDEAWRALAKEEIGKTGLLAGAPILDTKVIRVPKCYPVYRKGYTKWLAPVQDFIRSACPSVLPIGRYGSFKYNNQDHSILMGMLAAENIADGAQHDLWNINTDYDEYQEGAATGDEG